MHQRFPLASHRIDAKAQMNQPADGEKQRQTELEQKPNENIVVCVQTKCIIAGTSLLTS